MGKTISLFLGVFIISLGFAYFLAALLDESVAFFLVLTTMGSVIIVYLVWIVRQIKDINEIVMMLRKTSNK